MGRIGLRSLQERVEIWLRSEARDRVPSCVSPLLEVANRWQSWLSPSCDNTVCRIQNWRAGSAFVLFGARRFMPSLPGAGDNRGVLYQISTYTGVPSWRGYPDSGTGSQ